MILIASYIYIFYKSKYFLYIIENLNRRWPMPDEQARTIYISTEGITPRVRRMSEADKTKLFDSGKRAVIQNLQGL